MAVCVSVFVCSLPSMGLMQDTGYNVSMCCVVLSWWYVFMCLLPSMGLMQGTGYNVSMCCGV